VSSALPLGDGVLCACDRCRRLRPATAGREGDEIAIRCATCGARLHLYEA